METKYIINTLSGNAINVTRETFMDYLNMLDYSYPDYEVNTFKNDLGHVWLTARAYFIVKDGERQIACQVEEWEKK